MNSEEFHDALYRERCRRETVEASNRRMRSALEKIASPTQTTDLLWWQIEAREALAKVGAGDTATKGLHPSHEPGYAAKVALEHNVKVSVLPQPGGD